MYFSLVMRVISPDLISASMAWGMSSAYASGTLALSARRVVIFPGRVSIPARRKSPALLSLLIAARPVATVAPVVARVGELIDLHRLVDGGKGEHYELRDAVALGDVVRGVAVVLEVDH